MRYAFDAVYQSFVFLYEIRLYLIEMEKKIEYKRDTLLGSKLAWNYEHEMQKHWTQTKNEKYVPEWITCAPS